MKRYFLLAVLLAASIASEAQPVKLACWNLLNYPDPAGTAADTTLRHPWYRTVVNYIRPDILVTEEVTSANGAGWFLDDVMNADSLSYSRGTFINGYDTDNSIYYRTNEFTFVSNVPIATNLRDISEFTLVHTSTGDTLRIYAVHLKASSGSSNEVQRTEEVDSLRAVTNRLAPGRNFVVCGDFNIYGSYESAYQGLLMNNPGDDGNFIDPLSMTGTWNNSIYSAYHTQSTRTGSFGGGASGGMNDRFDMILYSTAISQGANGISYISGSTEPVGNDGSHYNMSVNSLPNSAAPTPVLDALYNVSDHLPVVARFNFTGPGATWQANALLFRCYPNPASENIFIECNVPLTGTEIIDAEGRICNRGNIRAAGNSYLLPVSFLPNGLYAVRLFYKDGFTSFRFVKN